MENLDLLYSFFNQYLFVTAKNNIKSIEYYYQTNPSTASNPLVRELINAIKTYDLDAIGAPLFKSILMRCNKSNEESDQIMGDIVKWKTYTKEQIQPAAKYLQDICAASLLSKANRDFASSPSDYLKYLKTADFKVDDVDIFQTVPFDKVDINSVIADAGKGAISTNVPFINKAFSPHDGIERGQIGIICAPPGVGKTLEIMNLVLWMASHGEKVLYVSLADMNWKDCIVRMGSIAFGMTFAEAYRNIGAVYDNLRKLVGDNLVVSINPAGTVSAEDIIEKANAGNYSVVAVDYDGVLKGVTEGDSMYNTFGDVYNKFTELSISGKLVLIASQPKIMSYEKLIGLADIGESSRKQQVVDFIWTISRTLSDNPNNLYVMYLPKARRGKVGSKAYVIRIEGRFKEIPKTIWDQLAAEKEERNFTEAEIDQMVIAFNKQNSRFQQAMNTARQQQTSTAGTPFGK